LAQVFKTHVLFSPLVFLGPPEGNKFLFSNENNLVQTSWPSPTCKLLGRNSISAKVGEEHKYVPSHQYIHLQSPQPYRYKHAFIYFLNDFCVVWNMEIQWTMKTWEWAWLINYCFECLGRVAKFFHLSLALLACKALCLECMKQQEPILSNFLKRRMKLWLGHYWKNLPYMGNWFIHEH